MEKPNKPVERPASFDRFEFKKSKHELLREKWRAELEYFDTLPLPNLAKKQNRMPLLKKQNRQTMCLNLLEKKNGL